jgi:hypothetical protein
MAEIAHAFFRATTLAKEIYDISETAKNLDLKKKIAELQLEITKAATRKAEQKTRIELLQAEVAKLKQPIAGDCCPKCRNMTFTFDRSERDPILGVVGVSLRHYRCLSCGLEEAKQTH